MDIGAELETHGITISSAKTNDNGNVLEKLEASQTQSFLLLAQLMQESFNDMSANVCKAIKQTTGSTHTSNEGEPSKRTVLAAKTRTPRSNLRMGARKERTKMRRIQTESVFLIRIL